MPGYLPTNDLTFPCLFRENKKSLEPICASKISYVLERHKNVVIVRTPIHVESFKTFFEDLKERIDLSQMHVVLGVVGQGVSNDHIVTMHLPPGKQPHVYDSKYSNPERFFSLPRTKNSLINKIRNALYALNPNSNQTINLKHLDCEQIESATYHAFGTQSFFDDITYAYHTRSIIKTLASFLKKDINPSPEQLLDALINPVAKSAQILKENAPNLIKISFFSFLKKAWHDTFLSLAQEDEKDTYHFGHYFFGWPSKPNASKIAYFLTLKFITAPLTNLLSLITEFPLNFLSETCSFFKNKVLSWAPTHGITQSIRTLLLLSTEGLQGLFKGAYYLLRTVTSPLVSYKAARKVHPALGYLSALASVCIIGAAIAALAFFAPPIFAALMPSMGPGALSLLSTLAYPFVQLFSLVSFSLPAATGAMLSFATGALFLGILHLLGRKTIYPETSPSEDMNEIPQQTLTGSNVSNHLGRSSIYGLDNRFTTEVPSIEGESYIFDSPLEKRRSSTKEKTGDDFKPNDNQATIDKIIFT
ncbi:hypothetical protein [Legionella parisiensis]|uniref:Uncharacterized protein n=1 Tax=Legionella parisiensis TaxID=45071 RepID=A0A1E5JRJ8_9GAMM|nr:hypothetical protein [Legionella parisiensis]KTD42772.1 hypothetical protein Lpar_0749 [Legionella parisiensis]OEH47142.1 hypothetical protein lpari_01917 [Legionella parisiensis]STX71548.1 Uncharacterised protein [Legionella parisiensis]